VFGRRAESSTAARGDAGGSLLQQRSDVHQFQAQSECPRDGLEAGELRIAPVFDVADRAGVGDARPLGHCLPSEALGLTGRANLRRHARGRGH